MLIIFAAFVFYYTIDILLRIRKQWQKLTEEENKPQSGKKK